jgi:hypothetical protein
MAGALQFGSPVQTGPLQDGSLLQTGLLHEGSAGHASGGAEQSGPMTGGIMQVLQSPQPPHSQGAGGQQAA